VRAPPIEATPMRHLAGLGIPLVDDRREHFVRSGQPGNDRFPTAA
jgi:hypothetical protein